MQNPQRSWPAPARPWIIAQNWSDVLFAHWPYEPAAIRRHLPRGVTLDVRDGAAWVGVVPFLITGFRGRALPPVPTAHRFLEVNVRTYVSCDGKPGVWFFSLDAESRLAVMGARVAFHLPYFHARMRFGRQGDSRIYASRRSGSPAVAFHARYQPMGSVFHAAAGSFDQWLTERYCLYAVNARGRLARTEIDHPPWPLQRADADVDAAALLTAGGLPPPAAAPILHYASYQPVRTWAPARVRRHS